MNAILLILLASGGGSDPEAGVALIHSIGADLRLMRAMPTGSPTNARCPESTASFVGINSDLLREELGDPDSTESSGRRWTYFFSSPPPHSQRGGGHPELTFSFGEDDHVTHASCHYSR
jgi:hypothetical protein